MKAAVLKIVRYLGFLSFSVNSSGNNEGYNEKKFSSTLQNSIIF